MPDPILTVHGLTKRFGGVVAVGGVDLLVPAGSITALIGPNGAGKTTLFNMVSSLYTPTEGEVRFLGRNKEGDVTSGVRPDLVAAMGIARTFQNIRLFGELSVLDNVRVGFHLRSHSHGKSEEGFFHSISSLASECAAVILKTKRSRSEEEAVTLAGLKYLEFVGILEYSQHRADSLPYGLQRRVEIARALASGPRLLLLDEPAAGMNPQETEELCGLIERIRDAGVTVFLIEHDMSLVMRVSESITVLDHGVVISRGTPAEIRSDQKVIEAYLGVEGEEY